MYLLTFTGLSPAMVQLSRRFNLTYTLMSQSYNPKMALTILVWAIPRSLATTWGITVVFFSSGYLDVSVPRVRFVQLCIHCTIPTIK